MATSWKFESSPGHHLFDEILALGKSLIGTRFVGLDQQSTKVGEQSSQRAQVAELVDALGSGPSDGNIVEVRVFSWAPLFSEKPSHWLGFFVSAFGKIQVAAEQQHDSESMNALILKGVHPSSAANKKAARGRPS